MKESRPTRYPVLYSTLALSVAFGLPAIGEEKKDQPKPQQRHRVEQIDYGGFFAGST